MSNANSQISGIIFSNRTNFAYKFRNKASRLGVHLEYKHTLSELLDYLIEFDEGIIFVDNRSEKYHKYLKEFTLKQTSKNLTIVFVTDNSDIKLECDNIFTFKTSYEELQETLPNIISMMRSRKNRIDGPNNCEIDEYLRVINKEFCLIERLTGYQYICDCVKIFVGSIDKKYNILKDAYAIIANRYKKNISNVEKSIRSVIGKALLKNYETFYKTFNESKVSNSTYITYLVSKVKEMHYNKFNLN